MGSVVTLVVLSSFRSAHAADYTGDGIDDLAIGVEELYVGAVLRPGAVEMMRGSSRGLTSTGDLFLHQDTPGVSDLNEEEDYFGRALGAGDVDGDGKDDLIVGGPLEDVGGLHCGAIWRIEFTAAVTSLTVSTSQLYSQATAGVSGTAEEDDYFGEAIAVADFDGDGYDDVVVGIWGEDIGTASDAGAIEYLRGSATGLTTTGQKEIDQNTTDVSGAAEAGDWFGWVLAAGDFDGDDYADVAIGVPFEDWTWTDEGSVHVMYGSSSGPSAANDELWGAGEGTAAGTTGPSSCGSALAVGDFDADGYDDLAMGCPYSDTSTTSDSGSVLVIYGGSSGLGTSELWTQSTAGVVGTPETNDWFGHELTSGDYDGDGYDDLVIAALNEEYAGVAGAGVVHVLFGSSGGVTATDNLLLAQDVSGVLGSGSATENWGFSLTSGDYDDDGYDDLAVGSPYDDDGGDVWAGVVNLFYGSASGPSTTGDAMYDQDSTGVEGVVEGDDVFGYSLR